MGTRNYGPKQAGNHCFSFGGCPRGCRARDARRNLAIAKNADSIDNQAGKVVAELRCSIPARWFDHGFRLVTGLQISSRGRQHSIRAVRHQGLHSSKAM